MIFKRTESGVDFRFSGSAHILGGCTSDFRRAQRAGNFGGWCSKTPGGVVYVCEMTCVIYLPHIVLGISVSLSIGLRLALLKGDVAAAPGWQARTGDGDQDWLEWISKYVEDDATHEV